MYRPLLVPALLLLGLLALERVMGMEAAVTKALTVAMGAAYAATLAIRRRLPASLARHAATALYVALLPPDELTPIVEFVKLPVVLVIASLSFFTLYDKVGAPLLEALGYSLIYLSLYFALGDLMPGTSTPLLAASIYVLALSLLPTSRYKYHVTTSPIVLGGLLALSGEGLLRYVGGTLIGVGAATTMYRFFVGRAAASAVEELSGGPLAEGDLAEAYMEYTRGNVKRLAAIIAARLASAGYTWQEIACVVEPVLDRRLKDAVERLRHGCP